MANETNKNSRTDHKDDESCKEKTMAVTLKPCKVSGGLKKAKAECVRHAAKMDKTEKKTSQTKSAYEVVQQLDSRASPVLQPIPKEV